MKELATNRKAKFNYSIIDILNAGIVLTGTEIKSIRNGGASISEAYAVVRDMEVWLCNMSIAPYEMGNLHNHSQYRERKLLLNRKEIINCDKAISIKGNTLVPLSLYLSNGFAKIKLAICKGKNVVDKRQKIKEKDENREIERSIKRKNI